MSISDEEREFRRRDEPESVSVIGNALRPRKMTHRRIRYDARIMLIGEPFGQFVLCIAESQQAKLPRSVERNPGGVPDLRTRSFQGDSPRRYCRMTPSLALPQR